MATVADVRALALTLPRTTEHLIYDRVKFRVGAIVYIAFSRDEATMGFAYPKHERDALVARALGKCARVRRRDCHRSPQRRTRCPIRRSTRATSRASGDPTTLK